jgi:hypothetical protein
MSYGSLTQRFLLVAVASALDRDTTSLRWRARVAKAAASQETKDTADDGDHTKARSRRRWFQWQDGLAAAAVASSLLSLQFCPHSPLVTVASVLTILLAPLMSFQSRKLKGRNFRVIANELRQEINYCHVEQERLYRTLARLDSRMDQVHAVEKELRKYDPSQVNKLTRIVQEQAAIHKRTNRILQQRVIQTIMKVVVLADLDQDGHVGPREMEGLMLKLQNLPGVRLDEYKFRAKMAAGDRSLRTVMEIMRDLDDSDVFQFRPEELSQQANLLLDVRL